jgi:hypothetical protein
MLDIQQKAEQDLRFIREAMARVEGVSSVSGLGGILMGAIALSAAAVAANKIALDEQLYVWVMAAIVASITGSLACWHKANKTGSLVHWDPIRRFLLCLVPVIAVAALLTWRLWESEAIVFVPALWMMLYGCGVLAAGTYAVGVVLTLGGCFIVIGACSLVLPVEWSNALLALSFGGLHIVFGWWLFKHHGG